MTTSNTEGIEAALLHGEIDLGIIEGYSKNRSIRYETFLKDEIVLVANSHHPLAKKAVIKPEELKQIHLLLREPGSGTLDVVSHALKTQSIKLSQLSIEMQMDSTESIKQYLLHSNCMAFLSIHSIVKELKDKQFTIIEIKGLKIARDFFFIKLHGQNKACRMCSPNLLCVIT